MSFFAELKQRNVLRVGTAYIVSAWLLIQVAETVFPLFGFDDTPARIVVIVLAIGFIPSLVLAWAFELTPEGVKKEKDVDRSQPARPQAGKKLDRAIMVVLALGLAYFAFDKFVLNPQRAAELAEQARQQGRSEALVESYGEKSIAVLAFDDMSPQRDQEYLSDGIAEELLNLLAQIPELRVISRSSAFSYKGKDVKLNQVAQELNVAHILEGSVRKAGNRIRITAQLIDARSDTHLWSETYDRMLDDVFAIQDEIAAEVVDQLKIQLLGEAPRLVETDPEAYALYLQARHLSRLGSDEGYSQSNELFQQVLAIDPGYLAAWNDMAASYINQVGAGLLSAEQGYALAREAVAEMLARDPDYGPAHARLGWIAMRYEKDLAQAARHLERALELDPANVDIIANAAVLLTALQRFDASTRVNEYATARDPLSPVRHGNLAVSHLYAGRWQEAIASLETALRLSPGRIYAHYLIGVARLMQDQPAAALEAMWQEQSETYRVQGTALALHALGREDESAATLRALEERWGEQSPAAVAGVYAFAGDADTAFERLDRAVEQRDISLGWIFQMPYFAPVHDDPRWGRFLQQIGTSPADLDGIAFEVTLPQS